MKYSVLTKSQPHRLHLRFASDEPAHCLLRVSHPDFPRTDFLRRRIPLDQRLYREITVPLPLAPRSVEIEVTGPGQLLSIRKEPMESRTTVSTPQRHRFMQLALDFAQRAGYLALGPYRNNEGHLIEYLEVIRDEHRKVLPTPARINRNSGRVQVAAAQFRRFSIPVRVAILAHEACHYFLNTRNETRADLCGMAWYLDMGFPRIEAIYAATKVFGQFPRAIGPQQVGRTESILSFIKKYPQHDRDKYSR